MFSALHIAIAILAVAAVAGLLGYVKYRSLSGAIANATTCGYIAPSPNAAMTASLKRLARALVFIQVGKIKFVGLENLRNIQGPCILSANHPHWVDAVITPLMLDQPARYMAHGRVMQSLGGLLGVYLSKRGVFAAQDNVKDGGVRTREAGTQMLVGGEKVVIFPEGLTNFSPSIEDLRPGALKIAREAAIRLGKPVYIVPAYTRYGKYPGKWLAKFDRQTQFFMVFFGFLFYRRGAVVTVGTPISTNEFYGPTLNERSDDEAMALLKERLLSLDPGHV